MPMQVITHMRFDPISNRCPALPFLNLSYYNPRIENLRIRKFSFRATSLPIDSKCQQNTKKYESRDDCSRLSKSAPLRRRLFGM